MACATLKRSCDWNPLQSPGSVTPKRRRCGAAMFSPVSKLNRFLNESPSSPFDENATPKLTSEQISANIRDEIKKLQRRKHLFVDNEGTNPMVPGPSNSAGLHLPSFRDQPLFSFKQVSLICERLLADRENEIKEEYDRVLNSKLAEQHDTFVKFTQEQIQKRFDNSTPTYLS